MSASKSPVIVSSQAGPHKNLPTLVRKYQQSRMQDTIPEHAHNAFATASQFVGSDAVILDSGCGTGESSYHLARQFPDNKIIALDKSQLRLQRAHVFGEQPKNLLLLHADCVPLWRLIKQAQWSIHSHYLFYPNPWPKPGHLQRRWHAHPVFPTLTALGGRLIMRTNWQIYAQEFAQALSIILAREVSVSELKVQQALTPFERKYQASQHALFEVQTMLE